MTNSLPEAIPESAWSSVTGTEDAQDALAPNGLLNTSTTWRSSPFSTTRLAQIPPTPKEKQKLESLWTNKMDNYTKQCYTCSVKLWNLVLFFGLCPAVPRAYSWLCAQGLLLGCEEYLWCWGLIKCRLATCIVSVLTHALSHQPHLKLWFYIFVIHTYMYACYIIIVYSLCYQQLYMCIHIHQ